MDFFANIWEGAKNTFLIEWIAVVSALTYLLLLTFKIIWCWLFALISSVLYTIICIQSQLYLESSLQVFYIVMAIWGWVSWGSSQPGRPIIKWKWHWHILNIAVSGTVVVCLGYYFQQQSDQSYPYLDATTTVFSLTTTFLVVYRVLSNWVYWIIIDSLGMILFYLKGFELTTGLFFLYTVLAIWGYTKWRKEYRAQFS